MNSEEKLLVRIGEVLRMLRRIEDESQEFLADKTNLSVYTIHRIEQAKSNYTHNTLFSILDHYDYHVIDFWKKVYEKFD